MAVINIRAESREISAYLTKIGIDKYDHEILLRKLRIDPEAYERYLNNARAHNQHQPSSQNWKQKMAQEDVGSQGSVWCIRTDLINWKRCAALIPEINIVDMYMKADARVRQKESKEFI